MLELFVLGLLFGMIIDVLWFKWKGHVYYYPLSNPHVRFKSKLAFIEHYHWALLLIIIEMFVNTYGFLSGFASALIISERYHVDPFNLGNKKSIVLFVFELIVLGVVLWMRIV